MRNSAPLNWLLAGCYELLGSYTLATVVFTLLTKVILFPVSLWVHRSSLKMVARMPELNRVKLNYYGGRGTIAEETKKLYKRERYHPLVSTVPMLVQMFLLVGVIGAVRELLGWREHALCLSRPSGRDDAPYAAGHGHRRFDAGVGAGSSQPLQWEQGKASQWTTSGWPY